MLLHCSRHISLRKEGYLIFAVLLQLFVAVLTLLSIRKSIIKHYAKFRYEEFNENLRKESDRHAEEMLSEISKIDYHIPLCNRNQLSNDFCALLQDVFHESSFLPDNLPAIYSGIFGSCLILVKRLLDNRMGGTWNLRKMPYKPSDFKASTFPYVNLGDFIFSADRQWVPTDCNNATKVAVVVLSNSWDFLPWSHSFLWKIIASLQRLTVHFGIFVVDDFDRGLNKTSSGNKRHIMRLMSGWDYVVSLTIREKFHRIECTTKDMNEGGVVSVRNINYKYNDVPSVTDTTTSEGHPTWRLRQPLFTKIATSSTGRATRKKRSGLRHKSWRLTNLKLYTNFSENDVQVSKSKLIPSDAISNEQR